MSVATRKQIELTIDGDDGNNGIKIISVDGAVKTIAIYHGTGDPSMGDDYFYLRHENNLNSLVELRDLISAVLDEAFSEGIDRRE